jgi:hypothetical protein
MGPPAPHLDPLTTANHPPPRSPPPLGWRGPPPTTHCHSLPAGGIAREPAQYPAATYVKASSAEITGVGGARAGAISGSPATGPCGKTTGSRVSPIFVAEVECCAYCPSRRSAANLKSANYVGRGIVTPSVSVTGPLALRRSTDSRQRLTITQDLLRGVEDHEKAFWPGLGCCGCGLPRGAQSGVRGFWERRPGADDNDRIKDARSAGWLLASLRLQVREQGVASGRHGPTCAGPGRTHTLNCHHCWAQPQRHGDRPSEW